MSPRASASSRSCASRSPGDRVGVARPQPPRPPHPPGPNAPTSWRARSPRPRSGSARPCRSSPSPRPSGSDSTNESRRFARSSGSSPGYACTFRRSGRACPAPPASRSRPARSPKASRRLRRRARTPPPIRISSRPPVPRDSGAACSPTHSSKSSASAASGAGIVVDCSSRAWGACCGGRFAMSTYVNSVEPPDLGLLPTFRRLLRLWREQWKLGLIGLTCALAYTLISIAIPILIQRAIDNAIVPHKEDLLPPYLAAIGGLALLRFVINFNRRYATARIGIRIEARMRELLYQAYLRYPRAFYDRHATGQVLSRATNDLYPIRYFIGWGLVQGMQSVMMIVGASIVLVLVDARLALYTAVAMPTITVLALRFARRISPLSRQVQERKGDVTEAADEAVVGIEMVQAFGREEDVRGRFGGKAEAVRDTVIKQAGVEARHLPGLYYLPSLSIAAVVFFGGREVIRGHLSIGHFVLFETLLLQLVWPLEALGWITNLGQRALASAGRSFAWLEGIEPVPEAESPQQLPSGPLDVRFDGVFFGYGGEHDVLHGLDLAVAPGEIVAVCGSTGAGKTSLLNLLPRFYDPTGGHVRIGGVDTRDVALAELRRDVALVTQRPVLFSVPLRENLTAGREDANWDDVLAACEAAGVDAFVDELPHGYDTLIGERGINLSGGQRQRVALARALVTGARVVVLDDPLSAVDTLTERRLVQRLRPALEGRTVLIATQRLSTVELADRAVVLENGKIVESGTPAELVRAGGAFARFFGDEVLAA